MQQLHFGLILVTIFISFLCGLLLWLQRCNGEKARKILAVVFFINTLFFSLALYLSYIGITMPVTQLSPIIILMGMFAVALFLLYPFELINPGRLNAPILLGIFSPFLLFTTVFALQAAYGGGFNNLETPQEILQHIGKMNVVMRIAAFLFVPLYAFMLSFFPSKKRLNHVSPNWTRYYIVITQLASVCFLLRVGWSTPFISTFQLLIYTALIMYLAYYELYQRSVIISSPENENPPMEEPIVELSTDATTKQVTMLGTKLANYMETEEPWRDPNICLTTLSSLLGTNRTSLSSEIRMLGYANFNDFIGHYRINEFCRLAKIGEVDSIKSSFYQVGFCSRSTALYHFKKQIDMTPGEYLDHLKQEA